MPTSSGESSDSEERIVPQRHRNRQHFFFPEPILLVEDRAELRAMLRKALERAGYSVDEAPDGNMAIEKFAIRGATCSFFRT